MNMLWKALLIGTEMFASKALWRAADMLCIFKSIAADINEQALISIFSAKFQIFIVCSMSVIHLNWLIEWSVNTFPYIPRYGLTAVNEMLSSAACLRGLSLAHESNGDLHTYREAMQMLLSGVRYFFCIIVTVLTHAFFKSCLNLLLLTFLFSCLYVLAIFHCPKLCRKGWQSSIVYHSCQALLEHLPTIDTDSWGKMAAPKNPGEDPDCFGPYKLQTYKCMNPCYLYIHTHTHRHIRLACTQLPSWIINGAV